MHRKNIVILGGGFGGVTALKYLCRKKEVTRNYNLILIDKNDNSEFLPIIADILAGWLLPERASVSLKEVSVRADAKFIQEEIKEINLQDRYIIAGSEKINYEYAVVSTGGVPLFFGNLSAENNCYRFNAVSDVLRLRKELKERSKKNTLKNLVIVGGGYTGLEVATNSHFLLATLNKYTDFEITIVDKAPDIMMMVPESLRVYLRKELNKLNIKIKGNDTLNRYEDSRVFLESGQVIDNAVCVWASGVKTAPFLDKVEFKKIRTRLVVDDYLNIIDADNKQAFVVGDSAAFIDKDKGVPLRQAIMFSIGQGRVAAENIFRSICRKPLKAYRPVDFGFLLPLTYRKAPGIVMGVQVPGWLGYFLHYCMCIYRSDWKNKFGIFKDMVSRRFLRRIKEIKD